MTDLTMPFGLDPNVVLGCAVVGGVSAAMAGGVFTTREADYLLTVPDTYASVVQATITDAPTSIPAPVPEKVSQTQFMRAAASPAFKLVTGEEAEAYLATGTLPAFVSGPLDALPADQRSDARLKAIGATEFFRSDALFALLVAGGAATVDQVDDLFRLADSLT